MDFGLREFLFLIGLVFIAGIVFDGLRRMRKSRGDLYGLPPDYDQIDVDKNGPDAPMSDQVGNSAEVIDLRNSMPKGQGAREMGDQTKAVEEEYFNDELPNGGARKVSSESGERVEPEVGEAVNQHTASAETDEGYSGDYTDRYTESAVENYADDRQRGYGGGRHSIPESRQQSRFEQELDHEPHLEHDQQVAIDPAIEDVIIFNIVAKDQGQFSGQSLLKAAEMCGMDLGEMSIFHRYEGSQREKLFSMANLVEPGTFDPDTMHDFRSPGVCLFMRLPGPKRSIVALERMIESARTLAAKLNAEMRDEHHSVITPQTIEHYRQRVMEFERKRRTRRHPEFTD